MIFINPVTKCCCFYVSGTTSLGATADHYEKQHSTTRNLYVPGVNSVQDFSILHWQIMISPDVASAYKIGLDENFVKPMAKWNSSRFIPGHYKDSARQAGFAATKAEAAKCQIPWPPKQILPPSTSCNWDHWCVWWTKGVTVAPPVLILGCGQRKLCQHICLCASLIWFYLFLVVLNVLTSGVPSKLNKNSIFLCQLTKILKTGTCKIRAKFFSQE